MSGPPDIILFLGRWHPLLVHLPIGFLVLLWLLEALSRLRRFKSAASGSGIILGAGLFAAVLAAVCGWFLSLAGGYQDQLLRWHKWAGVITAAACGVAVVLYRLELRKLYRWCLSLTVVCLIVASHFGASLTHGSDYLTQYAPRPMRSWLAGRAAGSPPAGGPADFREKPAFAAAIQPVLRKNCVSCHGPEKAKGGLRLDRPELVMKGGESGPVVLAGNSAESPMIKRLLLPPEHEDHMPPDGKPQPDPNDIALLRSWIDAGASTAIRLADLKLPPAINRLLESRLGAPSSFTQAAAPKPASEVLPAATRLSEELGVTVSRLSPNEPWLQCNASIAGTNFGDACLARLAPLAANLRWLDLAGTRVSDAGLAAVASMKNLRRLHLERTAVSDGGLEHLAGLGELEYLNLYGTAVTDAALERLQSLPRLKRLYVWDTRITVPALNRFVEARTDRARIERWQSEIETLETKIKDARMVAEWGTAVVASKPALERPMNTRCPVSGKPVDPARTVDYEGKAIAFCCDDCRGKFNQDPKPFLEKLAPGFTSTSESGKPQ